LAEGFDAERVVVFAVCEEVGTKSCLLDLASEHGLHLIYAMGKIPNRQIEKKLFAPLPISLGQSLGGSNYKIASSLWRTREHLSLKEIKKFTESRKTLRFVKD